MMYLGDQAVGINNDNRDLKFISTITITESLENDTTGNALALYDNYIKNIANSVEVPGVIVVAAKNNLANAYALQKMVIIPADITGSIVLRKNGSKYSTRTINSTTSAWCSVGTILDIYAIKAVTPNG